MLSNTFNYPFKHTLTTPVYKDDTVEAIDPVQSKYFLGGTGHVWLTRQALDFSKIPNWFKIATINGSTQTMAITPDGDVLFVGTSNGNLYRISNILEAYDSLNTDVDGGNSVIITKKLSLSSGSRAVTGIAIDPSNSNHVIVTLAGFSNSSHIYRSVNALDTSASGPNFYSRQGNLTKMPVYSAVIEMNHDNTVIVGTEFGVFATENIHSASPQWTEENIGLAHVPVHAVKQQIINFPYVSHTFVIDGETFTLTFPQTQNYGAIYAATHGRGFFENTKYLSIEEPKGQGISALNASLTVYPNPAISNTNVIYTLSKSAEVVINVYNITGRLIATDNLSKMPAGTHKYSLDCEKYASGTYIVQLIAGETKAASKFIIKK